MDKLLSLMVAAGMAVSLAALPVAASAKTAQQEKMTTCNAQAAGKTGDDRKAFMKQCLSNKPAKVSQQDKMKICNQEAGDKKGDERKAFMSQCLKK